MTNWLRVAIGLGWGLVLTASAVAEDGPAPTPEVEFFETKVRPILAGHCLRCHGATKVKAGLRLDSPDAMRVGGDSGPAIVPGAPEESLLVEVVRYDGATRMPPDGKLHDAEIAALTAWIRRGAPWPSAGPPLRPEPTAEESWSISDEDRAFWSFQPVVDVPPPRVSDKSWAVTSVDPFILARLEAAGLRPAPPADRRTLIRRVTFDLTGLPPTPEDVEAFVDDPAPEAYERLVDRLLASPRYGERWARHWLDVARYGEDQAHSFQPRLYPSGYRYRDWVVRALNEDMPYDRFVTEQIAADLVEGPGRMERLPALGYFACGPVYYGDPKKFDQIDDRIDTLTRGFLGLTVACARCHDHKFDPIPTTDYYALAGVFASTEYEEAPLAPSDEVATYDRAAGVVMDQEKSIAAFLEAEARRLGMKFNKGQTKKLEQALPEDSRAKLARLREELGRRKNALPPKYPVAHALKDATPSDLPVLVRGNPDRPGQVVPRRFLSVLGGATLRDGSGRLELARAIAHAGNPLTARVMVNRVWQHHFGRGLVATPSNFGALGERPSHPELLDHLAARFVASGWSVKALHRLILLSATYRQSGRADARTRELDPADRLVGRVAPRPLEVEPWRDAVLFVSGRLDLRVGGPPARLEDPANRRRTLYAAISRHDLDSLLRLFDFPDPNITAAERTRTTVPLQQLVVLNDPFVVESARALATRLNAEAGPDDKARIRRAYALLFGRPPEAEEVEAGRSFVAAADPPGAASGLTRWERYAQALLGSNEFLFLD